MSEIITDTTAAAPSSRIEAFSFGEPEAVLDVREILDYLECPLGGGGRWYEPPISLEGLAKSANSAVHHKSALVVKRNILVSTFVPHTLLTRTAFSRFAFDFLALGNGYIERREARSGKVMGLVPSLGVYTRRGKNADEFWFVQGWKNEYQFPKGKVFHLMEPDLRQEIYGLPDYIPALHSAWLNESATLFRRRYYKNGSHAGFILYMTDAAQNQADVDGLREALKNAKGPGNFRNLFMYAPNGKKDGIQLIPVAEVAAKDEFANIKNVTRDDQLAAHRVPPQLMGIMPGQNSTFGDAEKAAMVFSANEIEPLQARFLELNDWLGEEVVRFKPYSLAKTAEAPVTIR
ncbi:MAG: phage portal protein [Rhodocyclaceae bacterium]|nr:phage portal protein [Rhodocyclaceae bacterium]